MSLKVFFVPIMCPGDISFNLDSGTECVFDQQVGKQEDE
jgi:hypothetical protein